MHIYIYIFIYLCRYIICIYYIYIYICKYRCICTAKAGNNKPLDGKFLKRSPAPGPLEAAEVGVPQQSQAQSNPAPRRSEYRSSQTSATPALRSSGKFTGAVTSWIGVARRDELAISVVSFVYEAAITKVMLGRV